MSLGDLAEQGAPVVDDHHLCLGGTTGAGDLLDVGAEQGALARLAVAEDQQVRLGVDVQPQRGQLALVHAQEQRAADPVRPRVARVFRACAGHPAYVVEVDALGQQPQLRAGRPPPRGTHPVHEVLHAVAEVVAGRGRVDARQGAEEVQLGLHEAAARTAGGHERGEPAVDLGVDVVAEAQLETGAEDVAHGGPEVRPAGSARHDVQAEGEAAPGELLDLHLQVVEVGAQRRPAVDDEEHVPEPVVGPGPAPLCPVGLDRVDALLAEVGLAPVDHTGDLGEDAADHVGLGAGAHAGDMWEVGERCEGAAAEVEDEEL